MHKLLCQIQQRSVSSATMWQRNNCSSHSSSSQCTVVLREEEEQDVEHFLPFWWKPERTPDLGEQYSKLCIDIINHRRVLIYFRRRTPKDLAAWHNVLLLFENLCNADNLIDQHTFTSRRGEKTLRTARWGHDWNESTSWKIEMVNDENTSNRKGRRIEVSLYKHSRSLT